jgi:predicted DNA-binding transcriptional regulator AlpA
MTEVLRAPEAAKFLGLSESTLAKLRMRGGSDTPPFVRLGSRAVGYRLADLHGWLESRRRESTSDTGSGGR